MTKQWKDVVESIAMAQDIADTEDAAAAAAQAAADSECCICMDTYSPDSYVI